MIAPLSSPSISRSPRPSHRNSLFKLRPAIVLVVALAGIPSNTRAFALVSARNHKNIPFGVLPQFARATTRTMSFFSSSPSQSPSEHDSPTAFSAVTMRLESPSAERNKDPIWGILSTRVVPFLPPRPWSILETAAGAGVHTEYFASKLLEIDNDDSQPPPPFVWRPTDPMEEALGSIMSRVAEKNLGAVVATPQQLTLGASGVNLEQSSSDALKLQTDETTPLDLVLSINMIHISPWEATLGLMRVAGQRLREPSSSDSASNGGYLYCYGPYKQEGIVVPSNENFDRSLKSRDPDWGVRNLVDVVKAAEKEGLELVEMVDMPANNTSLIFRRIVQPKEN